MANGKQPQIQQYSSVQFNSAVVNGKNRTMVGSPQNQYQKVDRGAPKKIKTDFLQQMNEN